MSESTTANPEPNALTGSTSSPTTHARSGDGARRGRRTTKVGIVGAGAVGATLAYATLMRGAAQTVALFDLNAAKVRAEALDLSHGIQFVPMARVQGSDDISVLADSDVVVFTAGAKQKPGQSRLDLAESTIGIVKQVLPRLVEVAPEALHVMVTNPVDVVTYAALKVSGLPPARLFGSGTVLDSSRLRFLLAEHIGVAAQSVHAYVVGEHGDSELPLWSTASVGSVPLLEWRDAQGRPSLDEPARARIARDVVESAYRVIEGKGATNYAIGLAATRIVEAVVYDERRILPVSSLLDDYYGIGDVCLSVPAVVHSGGVGERVEVPMTEAELAGLRSSAEAVRATARRFGF
ncbi:L-lactate dehydrogenase [Intrasporangium mesophilum]